MSNFFERKFYFDAKIGAAIHMTSSSALPSAKKTFERTPFSEDITKVRKNIFHVHSATTAESIAHSLVAELIVPLLFLRIAQYIVCFSRFFEFFFSLFVGWIFIRMEFQCHLPVSLLDLSFR